MPYITSTVASRSSLGLSVQPGQGAINGVFERRGIERLKWLGAARGIL